MEGQRCKYLSILLMVVSEILYCHCQQVIFSCDFEQINGCGMTQDQGDSQCDYENNKRLQCLYGNYHWLLRSMSTPSLYTGPSDGYLLSTSYLYMEADDITAGSYTRIGITNELLQREAGPACIQFAYHMRADPRAEMGRLELIVESSGKPAKTLWSRTGHQEDYWLFQHVDVTLTGNDMIWWKGVRGSGSKSDIALDNIAVFSGICHVIFSCDFEGDDLCGIKQDTTDTPCSNDRQNDRPQCKTGTYDWLLGSGMTPSPYTGPFGGNGGSKKYIYMEATEMLEGSFTRLFLDNNDNYVGLACVEFYYQIYGTHPGKLQLLHMHNDNPPLILWSKSQDKSDWLFQNVSVTLTANDKIGWEGIRASDFSSDIALDDIKVYKGQCEETNSTSTTLPPITVVDQTSLKDERIATTKAQAPTISPTTTTVDTTNASAEKTTGSIIGIVVGIVAGLLSL